jgi:arginase
VKLDLIGVPYTSMAKPGGIEDAIRVLRGAGLAQCLAARGDVRDAGDLEPIAGDAVRGASGLLKERALARLVDATREAAGRSLDRGRRPLLVGADCPVLLGALAAGRERHGRVGLLLVDGHEDAWPPRQSETGEASDSEVAIALGAVEGLPDPVAQLTPLLAQQAVAMLGPRDRAELAEANVDSLRESVALFRDDQAVRAKGASASAADAIAALGPGSPSFWLHVDLDVLGTEDFPAADYLQPGGLGWDELAEIAQAALTDARCLGSSVVIYNPDLDPDRTSAARIVSFLSELVTSRCPSGSDSSRRVTGF